MKVWFRKLGLSTLLVVAVFFGGGVPVSAHVLESDLGITAELHMPPLDKPIMSEESRLQFTFENMPDTFNLIECGCRIRAVSPENIPQNASAQLDNSRSDRLTSLITFEEAGEYHVTLTGYTTSAHKTPFNLEYHVNVTRSQKEISQSTKFLSVLLIGVSAAAAIGVFIWYLKPNRRFNSKHNEE